MIETNLTNSSLNTSALNNTLQNIQTGSTTTCISGYQDGLQQGLAKGFEYGINHFRSLLILMMFTYLFQAGLYIMAESYDMDDSFYYKWWPKSRRIVQTFRFAVLVGMVFKLYIVHVTV